MVIYLYKTAHTLPFLKQWNVAVAGFNKNLALARLRPNKKPVHDLRVNIKKMRSYLRLGEAIAGVSRGKDFEAVKILFRTLGRQRNIEMSKAILSVYSKQQTAPPLPAFGKYLAGKLKTAKQLSQKAAIDFDETILNTLSTIIRKTALCTRKHLCRLVKANNRKKINATHNLAEHSGKHAHEIRKILKDVIYTRILCPDGKNTGELDKLESTLGKWQDYFIILENLDNFKKEQAAKRNISAIKDAKSWFEKKQREQLRKATLRLRKYKY